MQSRWARVARGWAAATFATGVAALSHIIAGGNVPTVVAIGATLVISGMVCTLLAGRALSTLRLSASVLGSQALFHGVFATAGVPVVAEHSHGASTTLIVDAAQHGHATMWVAHCVAAILTIVVLRFGETALWGLARIARMFFARLLAWPVVSVVLALPRVRVTEFVVVPRHARLLSVIARRGPPVGVAV